MAIKLKVKKVVDMKTFSITTTAKLHKDLAACAKKNKTSVSTIVNILMQHGIDIVNNQRDCDTVDMFEGSDVDGAVNMVVNEFADGSVPQLSKKEKGNLNKKVVNNPVNNPVKEPN